LSGNKILTNIVIELRYMGNKGNKGNKGNRGNREIRGCGNMGK